jgi:hypothetical protein
MPLKIAGDKYELGEVENTVIEPAKKKKNGRCRDYVGAGIEFGGIYN